MIQDLAPHTFDTAYTPRPAQAEDLVLVFSGRQVLAAGGPAALRLPRLAQLQLEPGAPLRYLFSLDGQGVFLLDGPAQAEGFSLVGADTLRSAQPRALAFAVGAGQSLARWYDSTRFCGHCGAPMEDSDTERARVCPRCGQILYPKICPAIIVAVTNGDRLLLTRYAGRPFKSYALVAGFNEIGETIEQTVHREVWEETGLRVKNLRFYKSQPWVFTDSLLMGFFADLDGSDRVTLQRDELAEGQWYRRADLPDDHSKISLTGEMIELFRAGQNP